MYLQRYGMQPDPAGSRPYAGRYHTNPSPHETVPAPMPDEGPLAWMPGKPGRPAAPATSAIPSADLQTTGSNWSAEVLRCFATFNEPEIDPDESDLRLTLLIRVLHLSPELHNLVSQAIRDLSFIIVLPSGVPYSRLHRTAELFVSDDAAIKIDICLAARTSHFFVLRHLIARKLPPIAERLQETLTAMGRPADAQRCTECIATVVREFQHADFSRTRADTGLSALRQLGREVEDNLRLAALALDDAQPPLEQVMAGTEPLSTLALWLIGMRADLIQFECFDFYENADRPDRAAAMYERVVVRLKRKVEQCVGVIDRLQPPTGVRPDVLQHMVPWRENLAELRSTPDRIRRSLCFRHAIALMGALLWTALRTVPMASDEASAAAADLLEIQGGIHMANPVDIPEPTRTPDMPQLPGLAHASGRASTGATAAVHRERLRKLPALAATPGETPGAPLARPMPPIPVPPLPLRRRPSVSQWLDLQGTQKKISRLYESLQCQPTGPDTAESLKTLLPHIDELSRGNRSLGLVYLRQWLLVVERQADPALYDTAVFSAARNLETMPIDQHARRFFDNPLGNVLAVLRALRAAAPEQAGLFLETLDLCLSHRESLSLPERLSQELAAMPAPYSTGLQAQANRYALAGLLHALAPHAAVEAGAAFARRLAEALGHPLPGTALRNSRALAGFACRLLLNAPHFHRADMPRSSRLPAHRALNLHDVGPLARPLLEALPDDARPMRVTVGGHGHQKGDEMPATRKAVLDWASQNGRRAQWLGGADVWVFRHAADQLPGNVVVDGYLENS